MSTKRHTYNWFLEELGGKVKSAIIATLDKGEPLTIAAIAARTGLTWVTAKRRLNELVAEEAVVMREIEGAKLFYLNPEFEKEEREP